MAQTIAMALAEAVLSILVFGGATMLVYGAQKLVQRVWRDLHPKN